jgi:predicted amidophosphoribosyltransferase
MCAKCSRILPFARVSVVGVRSGALLRLVDEYKYASERDSARVIARLLDEKLPEFSRKTVVSYITTSAPHIRERGFDHMELVAKHFAKIRKLKFAKTLARKSSDSQHDKNAAERQILAAKMFVISRKFARNVPENILLIDDIWTTGATAISAAKLLRENGVQRIELAIVARQIIGTHHKDLAKTVKM